MLRSANQHGARGGFDSRRSNWLGIMMWKTKTGATLYVIRQVYTVCIRMEPLEIHYVLIISVATALTPYL